MKSILAGTLMMLLTVTACFAETFFWEDKKGIQWTDDVSKLPPKFRDKYKKYIKEHHRPDFKVIDSAESKDSYNNDAKSRGKAIPESARSAVKALKKLEARCQAGISYRDYSPALGEAKFEVNMFVESNDAVELENIKSSIQRTMKHYDMVNELWNERNMYVSAGLNGEMFSTGTRLPILVFKTYPDANKPTAEGGIIRGNQVFFGDAIKYVYSEASKELQNAFNMLRK